MELERKRSILSIAGSGLALLTLLTLSSVTMSIMSATAQQQEQGSMAAGTDASSFTSLSEQQAVASQTQAASTNAACGQVVSGVVNLTSNLNCSGDGIIVGGPNTVVNMNGFSITGPGQDSSKVGIMVPNVDNVVVNGPGSLSNFQAGV
ncbi:MAG: hypothetical protein ACRD8Z_12460, partial [Nitrososphaeraceae archaeon]